MSTLGLNAIEKAAVYAGDFRVALVLTVLFGIGCLLYGIRLWNRYQKACKKKQAVRDRHDLAKAYFKQYALESTAEDAVAKLK